MYAVARALNAGPAFVVLAVALAAASGCLGGLPDCRSGNDCDDDEVCDDGECRAPTCQEVVDGYHCDGEHVQLACIDPEAVETPVCLCDAGFADLTDDAGCEDPASAYNECCDCMEANTDRYDLCLPTTSGQCVLALEAGAFVRTDGACALSECAGSCALVNCDPSGCRGY